MTLGCGGGRGGPSAALSFWFGEGGVAGPLRVSRVPLKSRPIDRKWRFFKGREKKGPNGDYEDVVTAEATVVGSRQDNTLGRCLISVLRILSCRQCCIMLFAGGKSVALGCADLFGMRLNLHKVRSGGC